MKNTTYRREQISEAIENLKDLPDFFPHHLEDPYSPQVVTEMKERYEDYIKQADTVADLMTDWL